MWKCFGQFLSLNILPVVSHLPYSKNSCWFFCLDSIIGTVRKKIKKSDACGSTIEGADQNDIKQPMKKVSQVFMVFLRLGMFFSYRKSNTSTDSGCHGDCFYNKSKTYRSIRNASLDTWSRDPRLPEAVKWMLRNFSSGEMRLVSVFTTPPECPCVHPLEACPFRFLQRLHYIGVIA